MLVATILRMRMYLPFLKPPISTNLYNLLFEFLNETRIEATCQEDSWQQSTNRWPSGTPISLLVQKRAVARPDLAPPPDVVNEDQDDENQNKANNVLKLTEKELNEQMPSRMLLPNNPQAGMNMAIYDYTERRFRGNDSVDQLVMHFSLEGDMIHVSSNDYAAQENIEDFRKANFNKFRLLAEQEDPGSGKNVEGTSEDIQQLNRL